MDRSKEIVSVSYKGIGVNLVLVAFKAAVGLLANSTSVLLDAVNNLSDALSSVITIVGTKLAERPPDKEHPYGYGRIEYITSSVVAVIVLMAGLTSLKESIGKIIAPEETSYTFVSLMILAAGVAAKLLLGNYYLKKGSDLQSGSLTASGTDAKGDAVISLATLVAAGINLFLHLNLDGWMGAVISVFILKAGYEIITDTVGSLIGERIESDLAARVKGIINSFPEVHGAYDLTLHSYGPEQQIGSVHVELDDDMTIQQLDHLTHAIVGRVYGETGVILTVGIYATNTSDEHSREMKEHLQSLVAQCPSILQMHGFYVLEDNVTFDLIFDFSEPQPRALAESIRKQMEEAFSDYQFHINLDRDFSD